MIPALMAKKYDAIVASMSITDERKKKVDFTNKYYQTPARFVGKKGAGARDHPGRPQRQEDRRAARDHPGRVPDRQLPRCRESSATARQDEANLDLVAGRVDLLFGGFGGAERGLPEDRPGQGLRVRRPATSPIRNGSATAPASACARRTPTCRTPSTRRIAAIRADGTYDKIAKKYFDFDIYGS